MKFRARVLAYNLVERQEGEQTNSNYHIPDVLQYNVASEFSLFVSQTNVRIKKSGFPRSCVAKTNSLIS